MQVNVEDISQVQKRINIEIPAERVDQEIEKAYSIIQKKAKLQGFRPGKAPMQLIKRTYADAMRDDVMRRFYEQTLYKALADHKVEPIDSPTIESEILQQGFPFKYSALVEVMPQILLQVYTGLAVSKEQYVAKSESIDAELKRMQESMAQLVPLNEECSVENGQTVSVDYSVMLEGSFEETNSAKDVMVEVGLNQLIPGFEDQLIGMKSGERKQFTLYLPSNESSSEVPAKRGIFDVTINEIKRKELPELNDDFAQQLGDFDSLEELKDKMAEYHQKHELERIENEFKERAIQALIQKNPIDVPESMVRRQLDYMFENLKNRLKSQQTTIESIGLDSEGFRARFYDDAADKVRGGLLLMALVEKENISVSDEDLNAHYEKTAAGNQEMLERINAYYTSNQNAKLSVISEIKENKAIAFLIEKAIVTVTNADQSVAA
jgi:trigger factor